MRLLPILAGFFALLCLPLLLSDRETNYSWDEASYHLPAIRQIHAHWPRLDLAGDSLSATAPGYHYVLAGIGRLTGTSRPAMRLLNFTVSFCALALLCCAWPRNTTERTILLAIAPLAFSNFFVKSASYVVTDNAALLTVAAALLAVLIAPSPRGPRWAGGLAALSVGIRQSGIWLLAPLTAAIAGASDRRQHPLRWLLLLPALMVLGCLFYGWGGPVPPAWRAAHLTATVFVPASGTYLLAVLAILGPAYYYAAARPGEWREDFLSRWAGAGALAGLVIALAGPTVPDYDAGRWGGYLWDLAARLPAMADYSVLFLLLAPGGGALLGMLGRRLWVEAGPAITLTWLAAFLGWAGTGFVNRQVFHRYYEPTILVLLICWLLVLLRARPTAAPLRLKPLAALGAVQLLLTLLTAHARTFGLI